MPDQTATPANSSAVSPTLESLTAVFQDVARSLATQAPEGLRAADAAAFCGVSRSKWHDLNTRGLIPSPVQLGFDRCPRWVRRELLAWLLAGAPARVRWVTMREQALRRVPQS